MAGGYYTAIETVKDYGEYLEDVFCSLSKVGQFCPIKPGRGGGILLRETEYSLTEISYSRWAISELLERLEYCVPDTELSVMEDFSRELDEYSRLNSKNSHMFLVAYEIVNNAIDLFHSQ